MIIHCRTHASRFEKQLLRIDSSVRTVNKTDRARRNAGRNGFRSPGHDRMSRTQTLGRSICSQSELDDRTPIVRMARRHGSTHQINIGVEKPTQHRNKKMRPITILQESSGQCGYECTTVTRVIVRLPWRVCKPKCERPLSIAESACSRSCLEVPSDQSENSHLLCPQKVLLP